MNNFYDGFFNCPFSFQIILKVYSHDDSEKCFEVPITPETICHDVVACVSSDSSSYLAQLWNGQGGW